MKKIKIRVTNNKCKLEGPLKALIEIHKAFKVRHPNAYFVKLHGNVTREWDGKINYVTDRFFFKSGLLQSVHDFIVDELGRKVKMLDERDTFGVKPKVPEKVGNMIARPYQVDAVKALVYNSIGGLNFPFGVFDAATNAGKTLMMAMIYMSYKGKIPALMLLNDGDLYDQFKRELPEILPNEDIGWVRGKEQKWGNFTVAMVQTLARNINTYKYKLDKFGIILVDEVDLADNKSYKSVLQRCYNAKVRAGLSGTIYMSELKKDLTRNQNLRSFFGDVIFKISKKEMVDKGHSTNITIKIYPGNNKPGIRHDWQEEYRRCITYNEDRAMACVDRVRYNIKLKRLPALVVCQYHDHIHLMNAIFQKELGKRYIIRYVHGKVKNRKELLKQFREGNIDILIASFIIRRGKNFPLIKYLLNAAGSDSQESVSQLMGRLERKHESKSRAIMEDFFDEGFYLKRHSKHRIKYYKQEKFKVIEKYKS